MIFQNKKLGWISHISIEEGINMVIDSLKMKIFKIISYYLNLIKLFFLNTPILKQEILLRKALIEEGIDLSKVEISCFHDIVSQK